MTTLLIAMGDSVELVQVLGGFFTCSILNAFITILSMSVECLVSPNTLKMIRTFLTLKLTYPFRTSIPTFPVAKNSLPKIMGVSSSSSMSRRMKFKECEFVYLYRISLMTLLGHFIKWFTKCKETKVGANSLRFNFL